MKLQSVRLVVPRLHAMHECSNRCIYQFSEQVFSFIFQIDVVFKLLGYPIFDLLVQLGDDFEAVLARIDQVDALQLLLLVQ